MASLGGNDSGKQKSYVEVVDFSQLGATDEGSQIDTGVTSGADPSEWDPIDIDGGRVDSCQNDTAAAQSGEKGAAAVCESAEHSKPTG